LAGQRMTPTTAILPAWRRFFVLEESPNIGALTGGKWQPRAGIRWAFRWRRPHLNRLDIVFRFLLRA
jgi:hypothetical protein